MLLLESEGHEVVIQSFRRQAQHCTRKAVCGRDFVLVERLQKWLRDERPNRNGCQAECLLEAAYQHFTTPEFLPVQPSAWEPGNERCCLLVLSILLIIDCGHLLNLFIRKGKRDHQLPLLQKTVRSILDPGPSAERFIAMQRRFCPAKFDRRSSLEHDFDRIIPISSQFRLAEVGSASVTQISIPEDFIHRTLREEAAISRFNADLKGAEEPEWVCYKHLIICLPLLTTYSSSLSKYAE